MHPSQNRVLSMLEALIIQTIDRYDYSFMLNGEPVSTALFAEIIGESVPPALIDMLCSKITRLRPNPTDTTGQSLDPTLRVPSLFGSVVPDWSREAR